MQTIPTLKRLIAAGTLAALVACGTPDPQPAAPPAQAEDCDAEDLAKREDDCGRYVNGVFVPWSWVSRGQRTPPRGWTKASELRTATTAAPRSTRTSGATVPRTNTAPAQPKPKKPASGGTRRSK
ncbi:hypothetical protein [Micromonospora sp. DT227]|uniref:hypothetical protein n=1 Tax=Micromonospora sp. DT227 TaxID=3393433 RepID=UPI003CE80260